MKKDSPPTVIGDWYAKIDGLFAKHFPQDFSHTIGNKGFLGLKTQHDDAAVSQQGFGPGDALLSIDIVIQASIRHGGGGMRIQESERNNVVTLLAGSKEGTGVIIDQLDGRGGVRPFGMMTFTQRNDGWIDFHRSDLFDSVAQCPGCIISGSGSND